MSGITIVSLATFILVSIAILVIAQTTFVYLSNNNKKVYEKLGKPDLFYGNSFTLTKSLTNLIILIFTKTNRKYNDRKLTHHMMLIRIAFISQIACFIVLVVNTLYGYYSMAN